MPNVSNYRRSSIIFFKGEKSNSIYLIKSGEVSLKSEKEESSQMRKLQKGEFFGLYSAIGNYPRQEDAVATTDVELLLFNEKEFESLIASNPKLSLQLMRLLSQELRRCHKKTMSLLAEESTVDPEQGLFSYIELYIKKGENEKAKYVIDRYLESYPMHFNVAKVKEMQEKL